MQNQQEQPASIFNSPSENNNDNTPTAAPQAHQEMQLYPGLPVYPFMPNHQRYAAHVPHRIGEFQHSTNESGPVENFMPNPFVPYDQYAMLFTPQEYQRFMDLANLSHGNNMPYMHIPEDVTPPLAMHPFGAPDHQLFNIYLTTRAEKRKLPSEPQQQNHERVKQPRLNEH